MGRGRIKAKNNLKKQYMEPLRKYAEQLEKENQALKGDPNTVIGQFVGQFRELYGQNGRLSVLAACLIEKLGKKVVLSKDEMEKFQNNRINIKWEVADGETGETAKEFTFTYELAPAEQPSPQPEPVECTDPNCTLPKDLKHVHTVQPVEPTEQPESASENLPESNVSNTSPEYPVVPDEAEELAGK
jgi:hypothetical protein